MLKNYIIYLDDGKSVSKSVIPAKNEKEAIEYVGGNGNVIAVKPYDRDGDKIDLLMIQDCLRLYRFGQDEIDVILRTLQINELFG